MNPRIPTAFLPLLAVLTACCEPPPLEPPAPPMFVRLRPQALAGDGKLQLGEQCDDGNTQDGDGCSSTGTLEAGFLCHIPGQACSRASLCGNLVTDSGEACDDGNTADDSNGCTATCDVSRCGNGVSDNMAYPSYSQEICDDGNRFDGDGCSRLCEVEPGFACAGDPSRCVPSGVVLFNTGVDPSNRRLTSGPDPHWFYTGTTTGAATESRLAGDWPQELQTARFMAAQGTSTCVYQDFLLPANLNLSEFRLRLATFNDNAFSTASVNGETFTPDLISEPPGQPWQKNVIREFGPTAPWQAGLNRIELCTETNGRPPNAFRYLFVDAYDDRCGDEKISPREECDDGNATSGDGCSASCGLEDGYVCDGQPSQCLEGCGDGVLDNGEQCDDGNTSAGDGCGILCTVEAGYSCTGVPSVCAAACGEGIQAPTGDCDDGNTGDGDGSTTVDTLPPDTSITHSPPALSLSGEASFEFSSNEAEVTYECGVDEASFTRCPDTFFFLPGVHTLRVRAVDAAGNADPSPAEYMWTVKLPHLAGGGCSAAPLPAAWLVILGLAALRRRAASEAGQRAVLAAAEGRRTSKPRPT
jgi:cysteine-rich repeat protein